MDAPEPGLRPLEYFLVRVLREGRDLSGLVEHLGSREKRDFTSGEHLLRLLRGWTASTFKMTAAEDGGNAPGPHPRTDPGETTGKERG